MRGRSFNGYDVDFRGGEKFDYVVFRFRDCTTPRSSQRHGSFVNSDRGSRRTIRTSEHRRQGVLLRLLNQDGDEGGGVDKDHASPLNSS